MYGSRAVTPLVLISDDVINRILKLDMQTNILIYVTRCCTDLTSKVLKERTFGQSSALLFGESMHNIHKLVYNAIQLAYKLLNIIIPSYSSEKMGILNEHFPAYFLFYARKR